MTIKFTNNAATSLASGITNVATSLTVASGKGALFPTLSGGDVFYVTLANSSGVVEIVQVTARSTDTFTIVRGQDGTTAVAWNTGDKVELRPTAGVLGAMVQSANLSTSAVTSAVAGTGISVSGATGAVTIGNTGVTSVTAGTGISVSASTGGVTITNTAPALTPDVQTFNSTGTWTKPTGYTMARVQVWAGGGGAGRCTSGSGAYGGGGGGYMEAFVPISTLAATVTATVGAGGAASTVATVRGTSGGASTFGSYTASGGTGGFSNNAPNGSVGSGAGGSPTASYVYIGVGVGGNRIDTGYMGQADLNYSSGCCSISVVGNGGVFHGGGGGGPATAQGQGSVYGGGGGGGRGGAGGGSVFGGAGGGIATAGTAPGGGGGGTAAANVTGGAGAAGRIVITCW